ncbi:MAG: DUF58 domain-containing protein [Verrucomicrobia bacterium]|nr:DUF58 domain-containing protein [Verrucomicrobiota bacterium]
MSVAEVNRWSGPGARGARSRFTWNHFLWSLVWPARGHRILPTISGTVLISLAMGIGTAAYNSSSNILFITLSLLLSCLILSGVLSWLNLRGVAWRLQLAGPLRAGHDASVALDLRNGKSFLPTYGLWFELEARPVGAEVPQRAESTITAKGIDVKAAWAKADAAAQRGTVMLRSRLECGGDARLEWGFKPERRGRLRVELAGVGSLFPFGFLKKEVGTDLRAETVVWPAPVEYRRQAVLSARRLAGGERVARAGAGGDLRSLRRYTEGDSHRLIHWKASARTGTLLVRQYAAESAEGFALWLRTEASVWPRPEQFELLVSFGATLAEDLFRAGQLTTVAIDSEPPVPVRRRRDLEDFLDRLAVVEPRKAASAGAGSDSTHPFVTTTEIARQNLMTFAPDGARGVAAYVNGNQAASA